MDGDVEPAGIHDGSLDTVANQVAGLIMDNGEIPAMEAYEIITRAYPSGTSLSTSSSKWSARWDRTG